MKVTMTILHYLVWTLLLVTGIYGEEIPRETIPSSSLAGTAGMLSTIVNGSVCVVTGELVDSQTDLVIPGPTPLTLSRNYSSQDLSASYLFHAWHFSHPSALDLRKTERID